MHYLYRYICILNVLVVHMDGQLSAINDLLLSDSPFSNFFQLEVRYADNDNDSYNDVFIFIR